MTIEDIKNKNLVLIQYLDNEIDGYLVKAEFSTNDNDVNVIVVQEETGQKEVFFDNNNPLYNYYSIEIFGDNIKKCKDTSVILGQLIGKSVICDYGTQKWQLIFKQFSNPRAIAYDDIRRVSYNLTLQCVINRIA